LISNGVCPMPTRIVPKNYRNLTGLVHNSRTSTMTAFESSLERDFLLLLDFDPDVESFEEQPVKITYHDDHGRRHTYTPDVLVHYRVDKTSASVYPPVLCEVKYRDDLRQHWRAYKVKFKAARRYAREYGWCFRLMTEREIRTPHLDNVKFLRHYRHINVETAHVHELLERLRVLREATPEALLATISDDVWHKAQLLPVLWHLVAQRQVGTDLSHALTMHSHLWSVASRGRDT
jgi:TnsA endonuclease N terminal/TnsA endonuclease C terminal